MPLGRQGKLEINCRPKSGYYACNLSARLTGKAARQGCQAKLPCKAAGQGCRARLPGKAAVQGFRARLPGKASGQGCQARLPGKAARQGFRARLLGKGAIYPRCTYVPTRVFFIVAFLAIKTELPDTTNLVKIQIRTI
jgi:hypothetical protein